MQRAWRRCSGGGGSCSSRRPLTSAGAIAQALADLDLIPVLAFDEDGARRTADSVACNVAVLDAIRGDRVAERARPRPERTGGRRGAPARGLRRAGRPPVRRGGVPPRLDGVVAPPRGGAGLDPPSRPAAGRIALDARAGDRSSSTRRCTCPGGTARALAVTPTEFKVLVALVLAKGAVVTKADLQAQLWGTKSAVDDKRLEAHIRRLRSKLGDLHGSPFLLTVRGRGFRLADRRVARRAGRRRPARGVTHRGCLSSDPALVLNSRSTSAATLRFPTVFPLVATLVMLHHE